MTQEEFQEEALRVRPQLLQVARRYLCSADAEDVVQDALLRLWQMAAQVRRPMDSLACVLTRNLCIDSLRRQKGRQGQPPGTGGSAGGTACGTDAGGWPGDGGGDDARIERLMSVVDTLPSLQQTILRLRHIEGMEMRDIAALTGTTEAAIRKALSRARQRVRTQYLTQYGE